MESGEYTGMITEPLPEFCEILDGMYGWKSKIQNPMKKAILSDGFRNYSGLPPRTNARISWLSSLAFSSPM